MAPEQLEGREADVRSDIFAFGCVLYEMLAGKRAFSGESPASLIAAILGSQPAPIRELQPSVSTALEQVIRICLAKKPDCRWQSARDLLHALELNPGAATAVSPRPRLDRLGWIAGAAGLLIAAIALTIALNRPAVPALRQMRFTIYPPEGTKFNYMISLSPNGEWLLFGATDTQGRRSLWLRALQSGTPQLVHAAEGADTAFWSPDGKSIGFTVAGSLKRLDLEGRVLTTLCSACGAWWGAWSHDGAIFFGPSDYGHPIQRISAQGGTPRSVSTLGAAGGDSIHWIPTLTPDHRHFAYMAFANNNVFLSWQLVPLEGGAASPIPFIGNCPVIMTASGWLLFPQNGAILAQRFEPQGKLLGEPVLVAEPVALVMRDPSFYPFTAADNGTLAWLTGIVLDQTRLTWYTPSGAPHGTLGNPGEYSNPSLSPDGRKLLAGLMNPTTKKRSIVMIDVESGLAHPLTDNEVDNLNPAWSPDGRRFAWTADTNGARNIYVRNLVDDQTTGPLQAPPINKNMEQWSSDGRFLIITGRNQTSTEPALWALPMASGAPAAPIRLTPVSDKASMGRVSPDGRYLAMVMEPSDPPRVVVRRFPPSDDLWQVVVAPGLEPQWSPDGKQLYWISGETIMVAPVIVSGSQLTFGKPQPVLKVRLPGTRRNRFLVAPDGRLLVNQLEDQSSKSTITVMTHWDAALPR